MSKTSRANIVCISCGESSDIEVYTSINVKQDPELRDKVLDNKLFDFKCYSCGEVITTFHDVLYHDPINRFMVWLTKPDNQNIIFFSKNSLRIMEILGEGCEGYKLRIARSPFHWIERIRTLECKMDDRIIELYKFGIKTKRKMPLETTNDFLHFESYSRNFLSRTKLHWKIVYDDGGIEKFSENIDTRMYQNYEKLLSSLELKTTDSWYLVDWQYPFGLEVPDDKIIFLTEKSKILEIQIDGSNQKIPSQFLEVLKTTGKGKKI